MNKINAELFGKLVSIMTDMEDRDFKSLIRVAKRYRKAQRSLIEAQEDIRSEVVAKKSTAKGLKYEFH